ncbi:MAG TPA: ABC transporter substrate-binding protein [Thermodesulfobacteriota bacterium]|nr:ABC transporter substrate-binding protein [Thermodesulfobacteriota bacterium]
MKKILSWSLVLLPISSWVLPASSWAQGEVKIGALYPMTGPSAQVGLDNKNAIELALEVINTGKYRHLNLPLSKSEGLPNLKGVKVAVVIADHQGKPDLGLSEAERLITQEKVRALFGGYHSQVTETASMVAERMKIPFFCDISSSPQLTRRGFKWFLRSTPHDEIFAESLFRCLNGLEKKRGAKFGTVGFMYEDTLYGKDSSRIEKDLAAKAGYKVVADIPYRRAATSVGPEIQRLKASNPDIFLPTSYASDAILIVKTMKELNYTPLAFFAQGAGYIDPSFVEALGRDVDGICSRESFSLDLATHKPMVREINELFKKRSGRNLNDSSARCFMGFLILCDAINRAGSTNPEAIREALVKTNIPADQLITPWRGVKFDETGQNILGECIVIQFHDAKPRLVWPFEQASTQILYPFPKWSERK